VIDEVIDAGLAADLRGSSRRIAAIEGRIGRLTPKIYRSPPTAHRRYA
jgi:hypothetical protein